MSFQFEVQPTHIKNIRTGDMVYHNGKLQTVSPNDLRSTEFMGLTLFGDCYKLGNQLVNKVVMK